MGNVTPATRRALQELMGYIFLTGQQLPALGAASEAIPAARAMLRSTMSEPGGMARLIYRDRSPRSTALRLHRPKWWRIDAEVSLLTTQGWHVNSQGLVIELGGQRRVLFFTLRRVYMQICY